MNQYLPIYPQTFKRDNTGLGSDRVLVVF